MANELQAFLPTGKTLYAVLLNSTGRVWDGTQFEAIAAGTWADNDIPLTEAAAGLYLASMPVVAAGSYSYIVYEQAGASPAVTDALVGMGSIDWNGADVLSLSGLAPANEYDAALAAIQSDLDNPAQYKADVSGLATTAHVQEVENKVDLIDVTTVANSGKIDAVDTKVSAIDTDTIMSFMIDGFTFEQIVQIMASVLAGKLTRSGDTLVFRDLADTVNRVIAETDANRQRTTMTYTV